MKINTDSLVSQRQLLDVVDALERGLPALLQREAKPGGVRWIFEIVRDDLGRAAEIVATPEPLQ